MTTREAKSLYQKELFLIKIALLVMANSIRQSDKISQVRVRVKLPHPTRRLSSVCVCICPQNISCKNFPKNLYYQYDHISIHGIVLCIEIKKYR